MILNLVEKLFRILFIFIFTSWTVISSQVNTNKFFVSLTFDDGPYLNTTEQILDILKKYNVKVTFFVIGRHVEKHPELITKIQTDGHTIGLHGYTHVDYTKLTKKQVLLEIRKSKNAVEKIVGNGQVKYFRPPAGKVNKIVEQCCAKENLKLVLWTFYPADYGEKDKSRFLHRIKTHKFDKYEIMLLHNGVSLTVSTLEDIIEFVTSRGGEFITLDQYFNNVNNAQRRFK